MCVFQQQRYMIFDTNEHENICYATSLTDNLIVCVHKAIY